MGVADHPRKGVGLALLRLQNSSWRKNSAVHTNSAKKIIIIILRKKCHLLQEVLQIEHTSLIGTHPNEAGIELHRTIIHTGLI